MISHNTPPRTAQLFMFGRQILGNGFFGVARAKAQSNKRGGGGGGGGGVEDLRTWTKAFKNLNRSQHAPHFKLWGTWAKALP